MLHSFDSALAEEVGVEKAVLLHNIFFWVRKNELNDSNYSDGKFWTYNSSKAFEEMFPYFSSAKISRMLRSLEADGYIEVANFNKAKFDRTKWYSIGEKSIVHYCKVHFIELNNRESTIEQPIPDSKPDSKPNSKRLSPKSVKSFQPPTMQEVETYFESNGYSNESAKKFYQYYSAGDWKDSKGNKVRNWKQKALAVWFKPENKKNSTSRKMTF